MNGEFVVNPVHVLYIHHILSATQHEGVTCSSCAPGVPANHKLAGGIWTREGQRNSSSEGGFR
jgi:hypothetical protein